MWQSVQCILKLVNISTLDKSPLLAACMTIMQIGVDLHDILTYADMQG